MIKYEKIDVFSFSFLLAFLPDIRAFIENTVIDIPRYPRYHWKDKSNGLVFLVKQSLV